MYVVNLYELNFLKMSRANISTQMVTQLIKLVID